MSRKYQESISDRRAIEESLLEDEAEVKTPIENPILTEKILEQIKEHEYGSFNIDQVILDMETLGIEGRLSVLSFLIERKKEIVINNLDKLSTLCSLSNQEIVERLIRINSDPERGTDTLFEDFFRDNLNTVVKSCEGDQEKLARILQEFNSWGALCSLLDYGPGAKDIFDEDIANYLLSKGQVSVIVRNLEKFRDIDHGFVLDVMLGSIHEKEGPVMAGKVPVGEPDVLVSNIEKFKGIDLAYVADRLLKAGSHARRVVIGNIENFPHLNPREVVNQLLDQGEEDSVLAELPIGQLKLDQDIAVRLVEKRGHAISIHLDSFDLDFEEEYGELYKDFLPILKLIIAQNEWPVFTKKDASLLLDTKKSRDRGVDGLTSIECHFLAKRDELHKDYGTEEKQQELYGVLKDGLEEWQDEQNVSGPFERGVEMFGYRKMFAYTSREGLSRHDALHNFDKVKELVAVSGLEPKQFYAQILDQVKRDGAGYDSGAAHHELNQIANNIRTNIEETIAEAQNYGDIKGLQVLATELSTPEQVFQSWGNLKKYAELCQLLGKKEILDQLEELKAQGRERLYDYVEKLAFHPNISMQAVMGFWRDPDRFLEIDDDHTPGDVHDRKKPSNYVHIPNLDLGAEGLRDALVEGKVDELQAFQPLEIEYELPTDGQGTQSTYELLREAVGMRSQGLVGKAKNPGNVFKEVQAYLRQRSVKVNFKQYLSGELALESEVEAGIEEVVRKNYSPKVETAKYRAKVNLKSDPDGVVAGNDTACCMPFGSGKNNVYTFNPVCSLFTLQRQGPDGSWRTVAQSVLTKDKNIGRNVKEVVDKVQESGDEHMEDILPEEILREAQFTLACDNVELSPNVKGDELGESQIEAIYRDFMAEYMGRFAQEEQLDESQVVIGKGYSDSLTHLPQIDNTYLPSAPVGYSDKTHDKVYQLEPKKGTFVARRIVEKEKPASGREFSTAVPGVDQLTFEDSLPVAYIEGKAYSDNTSLVQALHNMENALIAKDINNAAKDRPNMSLKYTGEDGKVHGYMLAYEGVANDDQEGVGGEKILYVSDIASDGKIKGTGKALMGALLEQYQKNYVANDNAMPIYAEMRDKTSYAIVRDKLNDYAGKFGMQFEMEELGTYDHGGDTMHQVVLRLVA